MRKAEFNTLFRAYAKDHLSPKEVERKLTAKLYESIQNLLGENNCLQIGSYPRYTAITPVHDLDVLYVMGTADTRKPDPAATLQELNRTIATRYENPTDMKVSVELQSHSVTLSFTRGNQQVISVDIVPAYVIGVNREGEDMYLVPEIVHTARAGRKKVYEEVAKGQRGITWLRSDPRGYITAARQVNEVNGDFRKAVKLVKAWRAACKEANDSFPLKSFHLEQILTARFAAEAGLAIYDAVFSFFCDLPRFVERSQMSDRADPQRNIDEYVDRLTEEERRLVLQARDGFLIRLEQLSSAQSVENLFKAAFRRRMSPTETYLFDVKVPVLTETELRIRATALARNPGSFREMILDAIGRITIGRKIQFRLAGNLPEADMFKWKVKNDDNCAEPRGEITDHRTRNDPESTKYRGSHYVECYAIRDGVCIAHGRQSVVLGLEA